MRAASPAPPRRHRATMVDPRVRHVASTFLDAVDDEAPGLVEGLYLTGSVALGDFRLRESDVDFVAVVAARPDAASIAALSRAHARLRARWRRPYFDGIHVTWDDLERGPVACVPVPFAHDGRFGAAGRFELNPVTWHVLAHHGVAFRGPPARDLGVWTDRAVLASWTLDNLESYWRPWRHARSRLLSPLGLATLGPWAPAWGVLGVSRLHYTLATGAITSKEGAGIYALHTFPGRWHRLVNECLRIRRGSVGRSLYRAPLRRRRAALDFISMVIDDARRRYGDALPGCVPSPTRG